MEILAYILAILSGLSLGLIGSGGSILTVPILVYLLGVEATQTAPAYSLFVVGASSLFGCYLKQKEKLIDYKTVIVFGVPSIIAVYLTRKFLIEYIPESILYIGDFELTKRALIMGLFAILMVIAAFSMIKNRKDVEENQHIKFNYPLILIEGLVVGTFTGLVGAGGGFLIIPALVLLSGLSMKKAVATSLAIIAIKSLFGFIGDVQNIAIDWQFLLLFTTLSIVGIIGGNVLSKKINGAKLKKGFGVFVLLMGGFILIKELILN